MMIQRLIYKLVLVGALVPSLAMAQTAAPTTSGSIRDQLKTERDATTTALGAYRAANQAQKLVKIKLYGDKVVSVRQQALATLQARIQSGSCSKIDSTIRTTLTADITTISGNLTSEKTAIDNATTLDDAKTATKSVFEQNRVFVHLIPAVNGTCIAESIIELINGKLTTVISTLKTDGIDTTQAETDLAQAKSAATTALALYEKVAAAPGDNNTSAKSDLETANKSMTDVRTILNNLKTLFTGLTKTSPTTVTPTQPTSPTTSPTTSSSAQ